MVVVDGWVVSRLCIQKLTELSEAAYPVCLLTVEVVDETDNRRRRRRHAVVIVNTQPSSFSIAAVFTYRD